MMNKSDNLSEKIRSRNTNTHWVTLSFDLAFCWAKP